MLILTSTAASANGKYGKLPIPGLGIGYEDRSRRLTAISEQRDISLAHDVILFVDDDLIELCRGRDHRCIRIPSLETKASE
jgi:hypothetical protein